MRESRSPRDTPGEFTFLLRSLVRINMRDRLLFGRLCQWCVDEASILLGPGKPVFVFVNLISVG